MTISAGSKFSPIFSFLIMMPAIMWVNISLAQEVHFDSVIVKAGHYLVFGQNTIYCRNDTVLILADTIDYFQSKRNITSRSDQFYGKIKSRLKRRDNRISKTLYKVTFGKEQKPGKDIHEVESSINYFYPYRNKIIRKLYLKQLNIFGTDIKDTTRVVKKSFGYLNKLHFTTRDKVIYNHLMLEEGYAIKPMEVSDNERVLRQLQFIKDAKIMVAPTKRPAPGVTMAVVTKDVFPLRFDINPGVLSGNKFGFSNINIFGTGHELETNLLFNDRDREISHDTYLKIRNVRGSFISSWLNVANSFSKEGAGIQFFRDFYTPNTLYAGGGEISRYTIRELRLSNGQILSPTSEIDSAFVLSSTQSTQDLWIGRAFKGIDNLPAFLDLRRWRILTAVRINRVKFSNRPRVSETRNEIFHHRTRLIASVGLSSRNYYKDALVNFFGRTEDIPAGNLIQVTGGYEYGEFRIRKYLGLRVAKGDFISNFGYLRGEFNYGGFFNDGRFEQGVIQTKFGYFTRLYTYNFMKIRHFLNIEYMVGVRRPDLEIIDLDDPFGIRGFNSILLAGTRRLVVKQESVFFTPVYVLGFRMATFSFIDVAFLKGSPFAGKAFSALGLGIRLRNENLAFNTIQLRMAFYPSPPKDMSAIGFSFATKVALPVEDFDLRGPDIVEFR